MEPHKLIPNVAQDTTLADCIVHDSHKYGPHGHRVDLSAVGLDPVKCWNMPVVLWKR